jgi:hypothetical protein
MQVFGFLREWPFVAFLPAAIYFALALRTRRSLVWSAALLWAGYGVYELLMQAAVLCPDGCARDDLLIIDPFLIVLSIVALFSAMSGRKEIDL